MKYCVSAGDPCPWKFFLVYICGFLFPLVLVSPETAAQEIAPQISYQGRILNAAGQPLAGPVDIEIGIYQSDTDPSPGYRELHSAVPLENGIYSILIGRGTPLDGTLNADLFTGGTAMLEVTINGETLSPRQPFASSAYAFRSLAETTGDLDIQGSFRVQAAARYFTRSSEGVTAGYPRCECDLDSTLQECGDAFFSNATVNSCYDWTEEIWVPSHGYKGDFYSPAASTPVSLTVDSLTGAVESGTSLKVISGEPTLVLRDTNGDGIRPRIRFENNGMAAFEGDDGGDQYFNFYSTFQSDRTNNAHIRAYGSAAGSWEKYTELTHDGTNGTVATDTGDLILESRAVGGKIQLNPGFLGRVKIGPGFGLEFPDGTLQTTAYKGFPRPNYDSGWLTYDNGGMTLTHNLGGNIDNYVVDLTFKEGTNVNTRGLGLDLYPVGSGETAGYGDTGTFWKWLSPTDIQIGSTLNSLQHVDQIRVRIWVYE